MHKFFVNKETVGDKDIVITSTDDVNHIKNVLRMRISDIVIISDGVETEYTASLVEIDSKKAIFQVIDMQKTSIEPNVKITIFQGVCKSDKMETAIQKCVEMGAYSFVPVFTDRSVVVDKGDFHKKISRWQKISEGAAKQSKRGIIPEVCEHIKFRDIVPMLLKYDLVLLPYENEEEITIKDALKGLNEKPQSIAIIIGPEGGFSEKEVELLNLSFTENVSEDAEKIDTGRETILGSENSLHWPLYYQVTLGKSILRTETAGLVAVAMCMYELEL